MTEQLRSDSLHEADKSHTDEITDANERIAYLRAKCINTLVLECKDLFAENAEYIIEGTWNDTLIDNIEARCTTTQHCFGVYPTNQASL